MERNNITNVSIHKVALGDKAGNVELFTDAKVKGSTSATVVPPASNNLDEIKTMKTSMVKLSDYITEPIDFFKLDIAGEQDIV